MVYINAYGACCALGADVNEIAQNLNLLHAPGMRLTANYLQNGNDVYLGHAIYKDIVHNERYKELVHKLHERLGLNEQYGISNNNKLLMASYLQIEDEFEALLKKLNVSRERVAVVMGTSTSASAEADLKADFEKNHSGEFAHLCNAEKALFAESAAESAGAGAAAHGAEGAEAAVRKWQAFKAYEFSEEEAVKHLVNYTYPMQELGDPSRFLAEILELGGPAYTISTACSSSLRAIITAVRLIECGLCDVAIAGGADTLSRMTVNGFNSMGLVAQDDICRPFAKGRTGITIGEASGLIVLSKEPSKIKVAGFGESSDAYHMSSPHPEGIGAIKSMEDALHMAKIDASQLGYINLHGTGTMMNDEVESKSINAVCKDVPCSSTKYLTGHTLGACGIWESVLCALLLDRKDELNLPMQDFRRYEADDTIAKLNFVKANQKLEKNFVMNNAFAFGGNNATVILESV